MQQHKIHKRYFLAGILGALALGAPFMAHADNNYPDKSIKVIVPFPPGGINDTVARPVLKKMGDILGTSLVVENKPGASGTIGTMGAAKAEPDGYTLLLGAASTMAVVPHMIKAVTYNPVTDFVPVGGIASVPSVLITGKKQAFPDYASFVKAAQQKPGTLTFGSAGAGTSHHTQQTFLNLQQGLQMLHIPYKGSGPAMGDLLGAQIDFLMDPISTAIVQIQSGKVQALGITSAQRSPLLPQVPTFAELGVKDFEVSTWFGLFAPKGTPAATVQKVEAALAQALKDAEVQQFMDERGMSILNKNAAAMQQYVAAENQLWKDVIQKTKIAID